MKYVKWTAETEVKDLLNFDIGIMPIGDNYWDKGKCAFKAIQYMALGIPCVISPHGANCNVMENNTTGYFAENEEEWVEKLSKLIENAELRKTMGSEGKERMQKTYSVEANMEKYRLLFLS